MHAGKSKRLEPPLAFGRLTPKNDNGPSITEVRNLSFFALPTVHAKLIREILINRNTPQV